MTHIFGIEPIDNFWRIVFNLVVLLWGSLFNCFLVSLSTTAASVSPQQTFGWLRIILNRLWSVPVSSYLHPHPISGGRREMRFSGNTGDSVCYTSAYAVPYLHNLLCGSSALPLFAWHIFFLQIPKICDRWSCCLCHDFYMMLLKRKKYSGFFVLLLLL